MTAPLTHLITVNEPGPPTEIQRTSSRTTFAKLIRVFPAATLSGESWYSVTISVIAYIMLVS